MEQFVESLPCQPFVSNVPISDLFVIEEKKTLYNEYRSIFLADQMYSLKGIQRKIKDKEKRKSAKKEEV